MDGNFFQSSSIDVHLHEDEKIEHETDATEKSSKKASHFKILKVLIILLVISIAIEITVCFLVMPLSTKTRVIFTGVSETNEKIYREASKSVLNHSLFRINEATVSGFFYENFPNIEKVDVRKALPDQVFIDIQERLPVVSSIALINGKSVPILIDRKGVVFQIGGNVSTTGSIILSGLSFPELHVGIRLHEKLVVLLEKLAEMRSECPAYLQAISEIEILPKSYGSFDLGIYPVKSKIKVIVDRNFDKKTLEYMLIFLDVAENIDKNIYEIDLRYGAKSFKTTSR